MSFGALPTELHSIISGYLADIDCGASISAFSLLSQYYHNISLPYAYLNIQISLKEDYHPDTFLEHYFRFHIISTAVAPRKMDVRNVYIRVLRPCKSDREASIILLLLLSTSQTLQTLYLDFPINPAVADPAPRDDPLLAVVAHFLHQSFPRLRHLTIKGLFHIFPQDILGNKPLTGYPRRPREERFPNLVQLHVIQTWSTAPLFMIGAMEDVFPNITHVHFSGVKPEDPLAVALNDGVMRILGSDMLSGLVSFPSKLQQVTVQYAPSDVSPHTEEIDDHLHVELRGLMDRICRLSLSLKECPTIELREGTPYSSEHLLQGWKEESCGNSPRLYY